ncbi:GntR family transcriptional regulator [Candidatus Parcubacteria bacterium]|nr:MAG: GntR family transcriptional regulator [Candidatus Parcubacteria bacterium]
MHQKLVPVDEKRPRKRCLESIRHWIRSGALWPDSPLPSQRQLADILGVNRRTLRAALAELSEEGVLLRLDARSFVVNRRAPAPDPFLSESVVLVTMADVTTSLRVCEEETGLLHSIARSVAATARERGLHTFALTPADFSRRQIERMFAAQPRGVILLDDEALAEAEFLAERSRHYGVPVVVMGDGKGVFDTVYPDHNRGGYRLARHLLDAGCRRFAWVAPAGVERKRWGQDRVAGIRRALVEAGLDLSREIVVDAPLQRPAIYAEWERYARMYAGFVYDVIAGEDAVDAILAANDVDFFFIAWACRLFGKVPNRDVLIAGYDNVWPVAFERHWLNDLPAASWDKHNMAIGRELVELLLRRAPGERVESPVSVAVDGELVIPPSGR